jgi:hypothetical protein
MTLSQLLSGIIALLGLVVAFMRFDSQMLLKFCLFTVIELVLIWFPEEVNDYTIGLWIDGYKIENPTPPVMIAGFGWILLLLLNGALFGIL